MERLADTLDGFIFKTLAFDGLRGGHTVETLLATFKTMRIGLVIKGVIGAYPEALEAAVRLRLGELLQSGALDMRSDGTLLFPEERPEMDVEFFQGSWWAVVTGRHIGGPFRTKGEANGDITKFTGRQFGTGRVCD